MYCRVSTEEQAGEERFSLKTQHKICEAGMKARGFQLAENGIYDDPGRSATNMDRPGLKAMLARVQEDPSIKAVFVQDTDRLSRNTQNHLVIRALIKKQEIQFVSVSQPTIGDDSAEGNLMDTLIAGMNQFQSQLTGRKTTKSMEQKFSEGGWPTKAPIGYINSEDPKTKKRIVVLDQQRAPLIVEAFKMYATGDYSVLIILDELYKRGLTTTRGKKIAHSKMVALLKNHFYYGEMRWRGMSRKGIHQPLIDEKLFKRCQAIMGDHNHHVSRRRKFNFVLRAFAFCAECGQRYTAEFHPKKKIAYYHCNRTLKEKKCRSKYVNSKYLEKQVEEKFDEIQFSEEFVGRIMDRLKSAYKSRRTDLTRERQRLAGFKKAVEQKLEAAEEKLIEEVLSDDAFTRAKNRYRQQIDNFEQEIYELERVSNLNMDVIQEALAVIRNIGKAYRKAPTDLKRLYLGLFWDKFMVSEKQIVEARKSPLVIGLEEAGSIERKTANIPAAKLGLANKGAEREVILANFRGA